MIEAKALVTPWQVTFRTGDLEGLADTVKAGTGGSAGMRPHDLLEAALAACMTISARMALAELGADDTDVSVRVYLERESVATRFRYELVLNRALEVHRPALMDRLACSPVLTTLSKQLFFEPA